VYGAPHDVIPPDTANPLPLLLPAIEMLKDFGDIIPAERIQKGIEAVLTDGNIRTADLGGTAGTTDFADALIARLT
jgi:isocitrate dehydrogenase (NAD+)